MTIAAIRERLYDYIRVADDEKLKNIYELFEDQMAPAIDWSQDESFVAELDDRVKRWEDGMDPGFSIDEVKESLKELRENKLKGSK
jgi:hypothetical protein